MRVYVIRALHIEIHEIDGILLLNDNSRACGNKTREGIPIIRWNYVSERGITAKNLLIDEKLDRISWLIFLLDIPAFLNTDFSLCYNAVRTDFLFFSFFLFSFFSRTVYHKLIVIYSTLYDKCSCQQGMFFEIRIYRWWKC